MKLKSLRTLLGSVQICMRVRAALISSAFLLILTLLPADFAMGGDPYCGGLCDSNNRCDRGCKCVYPKGASTGYCSPWYMGRITGAVTKMEGDMVTVKDDAGEEHGLRTDKSTKKTGDIKLGDLVEVEVTDTGHAKLIEVSFDKAKENSASSPKK